MGFFKKLFKGVKKVFKNIGKGIKSAFKKVGKFMGKIGIVGQLAVGFILPGVGQALMKGTGSVFGKITGSLAKGSKIAKAAGKVLEAGANFAKAGHSAFKTVTDGISSFIGEFSKTALKKIPGMENLMPSLSDANDNFFIKDASGKSAWNTVENEILENAGNVVKYFNEAIGKAPVVTTQAQANIVKAAEEALTQAPTGKTFGEFKVERPPMPEAPAFEVPKADFPVEEMTVPKPTVDINIPKPEIQQGSLLSRAGEAVRSKYEEFLGERTLGEKLVEEGFETVVDTVSEDAQTRLSQELGIIKTPEAPEYFSTHVESYIPVGIGEYGSPQINDRAMQMALDPQGFMSRNPVGVGAHQYFEQMKIRQGGMA